MSGYTEDQLIEQLVSRLRTVLEKLNPELPAEALDAAVEELTRDRSTLHQSNHPKRHSQAPLKAFGWEAPAKPEPRHPELGLGDGRVLVLDGDRGPTDDMPVFHVH